MAKFKRFDPRNKKAGSHKKRTKFGDSFKRIKDVAAKSKKVYYEEVCTQGD